MLNLMLRFSELITAVGLRRGRSGLVLQRLPSPNDLCTLSNKAVPVNSLDFASLTGEHLGILRERPLDLLKGRSINTLGNRRGEGVRADGRKIASPLIEDRARRHGLGIDHVSLIEPLTSLLAKASSLGCC